MPRIFCAVIFLAAAATVYSEKQYDLNNPEDRLHLEKTVDRWEKSFVTYLITEEERRVFRSLSKLENKLRFMDDFWVRRDPTPGTPVNEIRQEYTRRFSFANREFSAGKPGWRTDRGRIYIMLGPPHSIQRNPMGRGANEMPSEMWTFNNLPSQFLRQSIDFEFVDFLGVGDFQLVTSIDATAAATSPTGIVHSSLDAINRSINADLLHDPALPQFEQDRLDSERLSMANLNLMADLAEIGKMSQKTIIDETKATENFAPLNASSHVWNLPAQGDFADLRFSLQLFAGQFNSAVFQGNRYFSLTALQRIYPRASSGAAGQFASDWLDQQEEHISFQFDEEDEAAAQRPFYLQLRHILPAGEYMAQLIITDETNLKSYVQTTEFEVPSRGDNEFSLLPPVLCQSMRRLSRPTASSVRQPFQVGNLQAIPRFEKNYHRMEKINVFSQILYPAQDDQVPPFYRLRVDYRILSGGRPVSIASAQYPTGPWQPAISVSSAISLAELEPGDYQLEVSIVDQNRAELPRIRSAVDFSIGDSRP